MDRLLKTFLAAWLRVRAFAARLFFGAVVRAAPLTLRGERTALPFLEGSNLPWLRYGGDFGASAWSPGGGVSRPGRREALRRRFQELRLSGARVLRWFLLCDGRAGIRFSASGVPLGPDDFLWADIDAALEEAAAAGLLVIFVLFDFLWFGRAGRVNGVQVRGRRNVIARAARQRALRLRVIRPLLQRYGRSPGILAWDIINEPEWVTRGCGGGRAGNAVPFLVMRRFIRRTARLVRRHTGQLSTVGLASASGLPLVRGSGLDMYQVHWYDRWEGVAPLARPVRELGLDRPLLLGEFPMSHSALTPEAIIETARAGGYCGALGWSAPGADRSPGTGSESREAAG